MNLSSFRVVRLSKDLFPITSFEREKYNEYGIAPEAVEVTSLEELVDAVKDADAVMVVSDYLPTEVIRALNRCRIICRLGAGTDRLDVETATQQGIVVANVPDFCYEEQADHAFALLLSVARKLNEMQRLTREGRFHDGRQQSRPLRRLPRRTLGLVGFGGSAKAMARRAAGFGMRVLATRRNMQQHDPEVDALNVELVSLERLLIESDFVSLHLPLLDETQKLFDKQTLLKMKRGSVLINTARGAIVDEDALVEVLESQHLSAAGLDTFSVVDLHEPDAPPPSHALMHMENVVISPHVAAFSVDSSREVSYSSVENLVAVLIGKWPRADRIVNPSVVPIRPLSYDA